MATRAQLRGRVRVFLGTSDDDPEYDDDTLNDLLQDAYWSLLEDLRQLNPNYLATGVTLAAQSSTSRVYSLAAQSTAITDFAGWLDVRWTDENGLRLAEVRYDELSWADGNSFALTGQDEALVLTTSSLADAGTALWFRYSQWPAAWSADADTPTKIPTRFHDVVALEALFAFGLGGEQRIPPELNARWMDRRGQLLASVSRRGVQPPTARTPR